MEYCTVFKRYKVYEDKVHSDGSLNIVYHQQLMIKLFDNQTKDYKRAFEAFLKKTNVQMLYSTIQNPLLKSQLELRFIIIHIMQYCTSTESSITHLLYVLFHRHQAAPAVASCATRLWSSSGGGDDQRSYQHGHSRTWRHAVAGLVVGAGAVLAYGLHHHKVWSRYNEADTVVPLETVVTEAQQHTA